MSILRKISLVILSNIILVSSVFSATTTQDTTPSIPAASSSAAAATATPAVTTAPAVTKASRTVVIWNPIQTWIQSLSQGTLITITPMQSYDITNLRASAISAVDLTHEHASTFLFQNIFKLQGSLEAHIVSDGGSRVFISMPEDGACMIDWCLNGVDHFFTIVNGLILQSNDKNINLLLWDIQPNITAPLVQSIYNNINGQSLAGFISSMVNPFFTGAASNNLKFVMFEQGLTVPACRTWGLQYIIDQNDANGVISIFKVVRDTLDPQNEKGLLGDQSTDRIKGATSIREGDANIDLSICHEKDEVNQIDYYNLDIMSSYVQKTYLGANRKSFYNKTPFLSNIFTANNQNILCKFKLGKPSHMNRIRTLLQPWVAINDTALSNLVDQAWAGKQIYLPQASNYIPSIHTPWCSLPAAICVNTDENS